MIKIIL